jgi:hypothetical protein
MASRRICPSPYGDVVTATSVLITNCCASRLGVAATHADSCTLPNAHGLKAARDLSKYAVAQPAARTVFLPLAAHRRPSGMISASRPPDARAAAVSQRMAFGALWVLLRLQTG